MKPVGFSQHERWILFLHSRFLWGFFIGSCIQYFRAIAAPMPPRILKFKIHEKFILMKLVLPFRVHLVLNCLQESYYLEYPCQCSKAYKFIDIEYSGHNRHRIYLLSFHCLYGIMKLRYVPKVLLTPTQFQEFHTLVLFPRH